MGIPRFRQTLFCAEKGSWWSCHLESQVLVSVPIIVALRLQKNRLLLCAFVPAGSILLATREHNHDDNHFIIASIQLGVMN